MAKDTNGNYNAGADNSPLPNPVRAVRTVHTPKNPQGFLLVRGVCIAVGTGTVSGSAWKKTTTGYTKTEWVQVI